MATLKSPWVEGSKQLPTPMGSELVNVLLELDVAAAQTASGDIYHMADLPEDCVLVDAVYSATDVDTHGTPTHAMSFGILNAAATDIATALETAIAVGRAGTATRMTPTRATQAVKSTGSARTPIGYKVTTASATGAAGTIYLSLTYRAAAFGA